ncbi:phage head-tail joining protein [Xanthobacter versatilis]|uniref:phage head-tail joining protein n=1 Tax=Xanthobacter autotrophicus (strain ATCC BAA-1158 / Py2) TaxID=78245 RepID=UPI00372AFD1F
MASLSDLLTRLEALRATRAGGALKIREGEREVTYRSDAELAGAIADIERQIAALTTGRITAVRLFSSKGV